MYRYRTGRADTGRPRCRKRHRLESRRELPSLALVCSWALSVVPLNVGSNFVVALVYGRGGAFVRYQFGHSRISCGMWPYRDQGARTKEENRSNPPPYCRSFDSVMDGLTLFSDSVRFTALRALYPLRICMNVFSM